MTGSEIKAQVDSFVGETIDDADAKIGINEGIGKMGPIVDDYVASTTYSKNTWYNLPATCSRVIEVNIDDDYNTIYTDYRTSSSGKQIMFGSDNDYVIHYIRKPEKITAITDTPEMHVDYHDSLVSYLKGWFKYKEAIDDDEKAEGIKFMDVDFPQQWKEVRRELKGQRNTYMVAQRSATGTEGV